MKEPCLKNIKSRIFLANIEISAYICKRKTLLSLLNKQTSGLLFFIGIYLYNI